MKILKCEPCNRTQKQGKYCLDCGQSLKEVITESVRFKPISASRTSDNLKKNIRTWLNRIGVQNSQISIASSDGIAEVEYMLSGESYSFKSVLQKDSRHNLTAVEQFLHHRVLSIERGIESIEKAFSGYAALPDPDDWMKKITDTQLTSLLKANHSDTGEDNQEQLHKLLEEKRRRKGD